MRSMAEQDSEKKQRRQRRSFTDEFKAGAVRLVLDEGKPIAQVARDLDVNASSLGIWVDRERADRSGGKTGLTTEERAELSRLGKEMGQLQMEGDLPKKWGAFFANGKTRSSRSSMPGRRTIRSRARAR